MTKEKIIRTFIPAIPKTINIGIPAYNHWKKKEIKIKIK